MFNFWPFRKRESLHGKAVDEFLDVLLKHTNKCSFVELGQGGGSINYGKVSLIVSLECTLFLVNNCPIPVCKSDERRLRRAFHDVLAAVAIQDIRDSRKSC